MPVKADTPPIRHATLIGVGLDPEGFKFVFLFYHELRYVWLSDVQYIISINFFSSIKNKKCHQFLWATGAEIGMMCVLSRVGVLTITVCTARYGALTELYHWNLIRQQLLYSVLFLRNLFLIHFQQQLELLTFSFFNLELRPRFVPLFRHVRCRHKNPIWNPEKRKRTRNLWGARVRTVFGTTFPCCTFNFHDNFCAEFLSFAVCVVVLCVACAVSKATTYSRAWLLAQWS